MKSILIAVLVIFNITIYGQGSYWVTNTGGNVSPEGSASINQISMGNTWFGAGASYALSGDEGFKDNFIFNTQILYNLSLDSSSINLPIGGKLSFPVNGGDVQDISIGIYPYKIINITNKLTTVAHGGLEYNVDPQNDSDNPNDLEPSQKFKIFVGGDISIPSPRFRLPITLSITPSISLTNSTINSTSISLETTLIYPISNSLGLFTQYTKNFCTVEKSPYVIGVINNIKTN